MDKPHGAVRNTATDPDFSGSFRGRRGDSVRVGRLRRTAAAPVAPTTGAAPRRGAYHRAPRQPRQRRPATTAPAAAAKPAAVPTSSLPPQAPAKQGQTTVTMMTRGDDYIFKLFRTQFAEFSKTNPDISSQIRIYRAITTKTSSCRWPAVRRPTSTFECDCSLGSSYRTKIAETVDLYLAKERTSPKTRSDKIPWFAETYGGKRWGLPWDSGACTIYFNIDLFNAASVALPDPTQRWTWDSLQTAREADRRPGWQASSGTSGYSPGRRQGLRLQYQYHLGPGPIYLRQRRRAVARRWLANVVAPGAVRHARGHRRRAVAGRSRAQVPRHARPRLHAVGADQLR